MNICSQISNPCWMKHKSYLIIANNYTSLPVSLTANLQVCCDLYLACVMSRDRFMFRSDELGARSSLIYPFGWT